MTKTPTKAPTKIKTRKGPPKEVALANLEKAMKAREVKQETSTLDLSAYMSSNQETSRIVDKETCKAIMYTLGQQVSKLVKQSSKDSLLKNAYGVKSLSDTYQSYLRLAYPSGLDAHDSNQLQHLLGSILPALKDSLHVNIHVTPLPTHVKQASKQPSRPPIDVTPSPA